MEENTQREGRLEQLWQRRKQEGSGGEGCKVRGEKKKTLVMRRHQVTILRAMEAW